jgi:hypothetical protein
MLAATGTGDSSLDATHIATHLQSDERNLLSGKLIASFDDGYVNPLVEGSSPSPVTSDRNRQQPPNSVTARCLQQTNSAGIKGRSRKQPPFSVPNRPRTATRALPDDPALALVIELREHLPELVRAQIIAIVRWAENAADKPTPTAHQSTEARHQGTG